MKTLILLGVMAALFIGSANAQPYTSPGVSTGTGYPVGAIPITVAATATTGGATATILNVPGRTSYICGFSWSPGSATAAITSTLTINGLASTFTYIAGAPVTAAGATGPMIIQTFSPCLPATGTNNITVGATALGAGGINNVVNAWGYQF